LRLYSIVRTAADGPYSDTRLLSADGRLRPVCPDSRPACPDSRLAVSYKGPNARRPYSGRTRPGAAVRSACSDSARGNHAEARARRRLAPDGPGNCRAAWNTFCSDRGFGQRHGSDIRRFFGPSLPCLNARTAVAGRRRTRRSVPRLGRCGGLAPSCA
jgi:hypothetical protein